MVKDLVNRRFGRLLVIQQFSNDKWSRAQWTCRCDCGVETHVASQSLLRGKTTSCGCFHRENQRAIRGMDRVNWKGGTLSEGYRKIMVDGKQVREHRVFMSRHVERPLLTTEEVHHKNGIRSDNRLDNLELWSTSQPPGQRIEDKTKWAVEWLQFYAPEMLNTGLR